MQHVSLWWFGLGCFVMFTPLVWVRRIKTFDMFHIFADFTIAFGLVVIPVVYAYISLLE